LPDLSFVFRVLIIKRWKHDYARVLSREIHTYRLRAEECFYANRSCFTRARNV